MEIKFIPHAKCSDNLLYKISALKKQHWNYPVQEHLRWFKANLSADDVHVCVFIDGSLIAYTTVLNIEYKIQNVAATALGIGSVCVDKEYLNQKYGFFVVQAATIYILRQNILGFLLCKDDLVPFYEKNNWARYAGDVTIAGFNKYCNLLTTQPISAEKITLNKPF
ncbi:MAG: GNAT family N-acetyltransferase [Kaistella sp.]|nr:GNAT family N-acetyltransferase [Kaistella sp.]